MSDEMEKIYDLLSEAYRLEEGKTKISLTEEAVRLADIFGDEEAQIDARNELIQAAIFGGEDEKAIVAFSWMSKKYEENPDSINIFNFLWQYKWIVPQLYGFPNIPRPRIDAIFDDAIKCYTKNGASLRPIYQNLCRLEMYSGNSEKAAEYFQKWQSAPRDHFADCLACEVNMQLEYLAFYENDERALEVAKPILDGKMSCAEIPHCTYADVLMPLIRLRRFDEAAQSFQKGYKMVSKNKDFLPQITQHLRFLILAGNLQNALKLFEKHLVWALETKHLDYRFHFFITSALLFEELKSGNSDNNETIKLNLPDSYRFYREDGVYNIEELEKSFENEAFGLAEIFDKRNQNDHYEKIIDTNKKLKNLAFK